MSCPDVQTFLLSSPQILTTNAYILLKIGCIILGKNNRWMKLKPSFTNKPIYALIFLKNYITFDFTF